MSRSQLVKDLWPDKILYATVMMVVTGVLGMLYAGMSLALDVSYGNSIPAILLAMPPAATLVLSAVATLLAYKGFAEQNTDWAIAASIAGLLAFGFLGIGSVLSLIALGFALWSRIEKEDTKRASLALTEDQWPDKSLAASLLALMLGVVSLAWGAFLLGGTLRFDVLPPTLVGALALLVAVLSFAAARELYYQRAPWLAALAGIGGIVTLGLYAIGPLLGVALLVLLGMAVREDEFNPAAQPAA